MSWKTKTLPVVFGLIVLSGSTASRGEESRDPSHFTYARLYCAPDGNTHFQDVTVDLRKTNFAPPAPPIHIGSDFAASRAFFGGFDAGWGARDLENRLNHPTPATQFGIVLQGSFSITTTDGETTASRERVSIGGHLALQGTHHRRRRSARISDVRPVSGRPRTLCSIRASRSAVHRGAPCDQLRQFLASIEHACFYRGFGNSDDARNLPNRLIVIVHEVHDLAVLR